MSKIVLLAALLALFYEHIKGTTTIKLDSSELWKYSKSDSKASLFVAMEKDELEIRFTNIRLIKATCQNNILRQVFPSNVQAVFDTKNSNWISTIKIASASKEMGTEWKCTITNYQRHEKIVILKLRIKGAKTLDLSVGRQTLAPTSVSLQTLGYDGVAKYPYEDGEAIDFTCSDPNREGLIRLQYNNSQGINVFKTDRISYKYPLNVRKKMSAVNNNDTIECTHVSLPHMFEYTYRTVFELKKNSEPESPLKISVNDVKLFSNNRKSYQYKFKKTDDKLRVSCQKHHKVKGEIMPDYKQITDVTDLEHSPSNVILDLATKDLDEKTLSCTIKDYDSNKESVSADILFILDKYEPYILGLNSSDILQEYSQNNSIWIIHYQFIEGQKLHLTCVASDDTDLAWISNAVSLDKKDTHLRSATKEVLSIKLTKQHHGTSLVCEARTGSTKTQRVIKLYQKVDENPQIIVKEPDLEEPENITPGTELPVPQAPDSDNKKIINYVLMISCPLIVLIIIIAAICVVYRRKIKKNPKEHAYQNFGPSDTLIPTYPSQWETRPMDAEGTMVYNDLYTRNGTPIYALPHERIPKNTQEPQYCYIDPKSIKSSEYHYSEIEEPKNIEENTNKNAHFNNLYQNQQDNSNIGDRTFSNSIDKSLNATYSNSVGNRTISNNSIDANLNCTYKNTVSNVTYSNTVDNNKTLYSNEGDRKINPTYSNFKTNDR